MIKSTHIHVVLDNTEGWDVSYNPETRYWNFAVQDENGQFRVAISFTNMSELMNRIGEIMALTGNHQ